MQSTCAVEQEQLSALQQLAMSVLLDALVTRPESRDAAIELLGAAARLSETSRESGTVDRFRKMVSEAAIKLLVNKELTGTCNKAMAPISNSSQLSRLISHRGKPGISFAVFPDTRHHEQLARYGTEHGTCMSHVRSEAAACARRCYCLVGCRSHVIRYGKAPTDPRAMTLA
jgi:hypothetical protein